jgi:hypothetical protein
MGIKGLRCFVVSPVMLVGGSSTSKTSREPNTEFPSSSGLFVVLALVEGGPKAALSPSPP